MCVCVIGRHIHLWKVPRMIARIQCCKEKYTLEAQLHTEKKDLKHLVRSIYQGRGPRYMTGWWRGPCAHLLVLTVQACGYDCLTSWPPNKKKKALISRWGDSTLNVYTEVPGVESLQLLIQRTHGSLETLLLQQNPSLTKDQATTVLAKGWI